MKTAFKSFPQTVVGVLVLGLFCVAIASFNGCSREESSVESNESKRKSTDDGESKRKATDDDEDANRGGFFGGGGSARGKMHCANNLKIIGIGVHNFHAVYKGLPPLYICDEDGKPLHSWRVLLLPFIEQQKLYDSIRLDEPWDSEYNKQFHNRVVPEYSCPDNRSCKPGKDCTYAFIAGTVPGKDGSSSNGPFRPAINNSSPYDPGAWEPRDHMAWWRDGASNQIIVVEVKEPFCWMDQTVDVTLDEISLGINKPNGRVGGFHSGGVNVLFGDGSTTFLRNSADPEKLRALADVQDGIPVSLYDGMCY